MILRISICFPLNGINRLLFVKELQCVYCELMKCVFVFCVEEICAYEE